MLRINVVLDINEPLTDRIHGDKLEQGKKTAVYTEHKHKESLIYTVYISFRLHSQLCIALLGCFAKETRFTWDSPAAAYTCSLIKVARLNRKETKTPLCVMCCLRCHTKVHLLQTLTQSSTFTSCTAILLFPLQNDQPHTL